MLFKLLRVGAVALVVTAVPAGLSAQEATPAPLGTPAPEAPKSELQQIQERLAELQKQATDAPEVQAANQELTQLLESTMVKVDPGYAAVAARTETIKADIAAAQAAEDNAKLHELAAEAGQLRQAMLAARQKAMADPAVQAEMNEYKTVLFKKMTELDPKAPEMVQRLSELRGQQ